MKTQPSTGTGALYTKPYRYAPAPAYPAYGAPAYGYNTGLPYSPFYGKRSAEAEADPALLYNTYGYGLPYASVYGGYRASPYAAAPLSPISFAARTGLQLPV